MPHIEDQKYKRYPNIATGIRMAKWRGEKVAVPHETWIMGKKVYMRYSDEPFEHKWCYKCGQQGHVSSRCPNATTCFACRQTGHKSGECQSRKEGWHFVGRNRMREGPAISDRNGEDHKSSNSSEQIEENFPQLEKANQMEGGITKGTPFIYRDISPIKAAEKTQFETSLETYRKMADGIIRESEEANASRNSDPTENSAECTINEAYDRIMQGKETHDSSTPRVPPLEMVNEENEETLEKVRACTNEVLEVAHEVKEIEGLHRAENKTSDKHEIEEKSETEVKTLYPLFYKQIKENEEKEKADKNKRKRKDSTPEKEKGGIFSRLMKRGKNGEQ